MDSIKIGNIQVDVIRKEIKNMHLAVYPPNGRVRIAAPSKVNNDAIRLYAISKISWIKKQQKKFINQNRQSERLYISRESHYYQGIRYLLNIIEHNAPPKIELRNKTYIDMYVRPNSSIEKKEKILKEWYRERLKEQIPYLIDKWQKRISVKINKWNIKQMKTKWGTCNIESKNIILNLELAKKTSHCLEYIIVHELIHFLERHHNEKFVAYMDKFLPKWHVYKEELNRSPLKHENWNY